MSSKMKTTLIIIAFLIGFILVPLVVNIARRPTPFEIKEVDLGPHPIPKWIMNPDNCESTLAPTNRMPVDEDEFMKKNIYLLEEINKKLAALNKAHGIGEDDVK